MNTTVYTAHWYIFYFQIYLIQADLGKFIVTQASFHTSKIGNSV